MTDFQALLLFAFGVMMVSGYIVVKIETNKKDKR